MAGSPTNSISNYPLKRPLDLALSAALLLVLLPAVLAASLAIWLTMGRPLLFRHSRAGYCGRSFALLKFRTMRAPLPGEDPYRTDAARLSRTGRLLRRLSLDELPQLWNVLRGEMSLVGPRPLLPEYLERYTPEQGRRHLVLPGITGWAQVNGRQDIPLSRRIEYDLWYVEHRSVGVDLRILALTAWQALGGRGVRNGQTLEDVDDLQPVRKI